MSVAYKQNKTSQINIKCLRHKFKFASTSTANLHSSSYKRKNNAK